MLEVQEKAFRRAVKTLESLGDEVRFAVQLGEEVFGNATLAPIKARPNTAKGGLYRVGETRAYYLPFIEHMEVGDAVEIPFDRFDPTTLALNIASACHDLFGSGNYCTHKNTKSGKVEVLREG